MVTALAIGTALTLGIAVTAPRVFAWVLSRSRPDIHFTVPAAGKTLYLTIDDSPTSSTPEILGVLKKHDVPATFFIIANRVRSSAELDAIVAGGHALGNHLKTARPCSEMSLEEFQHDFDACHDLLEPVAKPVLFRPASGFATEAQVAYARGRGYTVVLGTVFPFDHWISHPGRIAVLARWLASPGGIVILHDGETRGRSTAAALDRLIPAWKADGYRFGSLADALAPSDTGVALSN